MAVATLLTRSSRSPSDFTAMPEEVPSTFCWQNTECTFAVERILDVMREKHPSFFQSTRGYVHVDARTTLQERLRTLRLDWDAEACVPVRFVISRCHLKKPTKNPHFWAQNIARHLYKEGATHLMGLVLHKGGMGITLSYYVIGNSPRGHIA